MQKSKFHLKICRQNSQTHYTHDGSLTKNTQNCPNWKISKNYLMTGTKYNKTFGTKSKFSQNSQKWRLFNQSKNQTNSL